MQLLHHGNKTVCIYVTGQNCIQAEIFWPMLILNFFSFLALIIHELGLGDKGNWESTYM